MTKQVRIENADISTHVVIVECWNETSPGVAVLVSSKELAYPTAMLTEYIYGTQYLVIKEKK